MSKKNDGSNGDLDCQRQYNPLFQTYTINPVYDIEKELLWLRIELEKALEQAMVLHKLIRDNCMKLKKCGNKYKLCWYDDGSYNYCEITEKQYKILKGEMKKLWGNPI